MNAFSSKMLFVFIVMIGLLSIGLTIANISVDNAPIPTIQTGNTLSASTTRGCDGCELEIVQSRVFSPRIAPLFTVPELSPCNILLPLMLRPPTGKVSMAMAVVSAVEEPTVEEPVIEDPVVDPCLTEFHGPGAHGQNPNCMGAYNGEGVADDPGPHPAQVFPSIDQDVINDGNKGADNDSH